MADAISVRQSLLDELQDEESRTLRILERVPDDRWSFRPHEKSTPMGRLAVHVATIPRTGVVILTTPELDLAARRDDNREQRPETAADLVPTAQELFHAVRSVLEGAGDDDLGADWTFRFGDRTLFGPGPRLAALRYLFLSHLVHHRAQLGVYLRLCDIPVPGTYGPSADEPL